MWRKQQHRWTNKDVSTEATVTVYQLINSEMLWAWKLYFLLKTTRKMWFDSSISFLQPCFYCVRFSWASCLCSQKSLEMSPLPLLLNQSIHSSILPKSPQLFRFTLKGLLALPLCVYMFSCPSLMHSIPSPPSPHPSLSPSPSPAPPQ